MNFLIFISAYWKELLLALAIVIIGTFFGVILKVDASVVLSQPDYSFTAISTSSGVQQFFGGYLQSLATFEVETIKLKVSGCDAGWKLKLNEGKTPEDSYNTYFQAFEWSDTECVFKHITTSSGAFTDTPVSFTPNSTSSGGVLDPRFTGYAGFNLTSSTAITYYGTASTTANAYLVNFGLTSQGMKGIYFIFNDDTDLGVNTMAIDWPQNLYSGFDFEAWRTSFHIYEADDILQSYLSLGAMACYGASQSAVNNCFTPDGVYDGGFIRADDSANGIKRDSQSIETPDIIIDNELEMSNVYITKRYPIITTSTYYGKSALWLIDTRVENVNAGAGGYIKLAESPTISFDVSTSGTIMNLSSHNLGSLLPETELPPDMVYAGVNKGGSGWTNKPAGWTLNLEIASCTQPFVEYWGGLIPYLADTSITRVVCELGNFENRAINTIVESISSVFYVGGSAIKHTFPLNVFAHIHEDFTRAELSAPSSTAGIVLTSDNSDILGGKTFTIMNSQTMSNVSNSIGFDYRELINKIIWAGVGLIIIFQSISVIRHMFGGESGSRYASNKKRYGYLYRGKETGNYYYNEKNE